MIIIPDEQFKLVFIWINLSFTFQKSDVFQYLADVEMNATINDDLVNEVCHTTQLQSTYYENVLTH